MGRPTSTKVTAEQNEKNIEKIEIKKERIEEYKHRYKNILWIDDDCGDNESQNYDWLTKEDILNEKEEAYNIKTIKFFSTAVNEIDESSSKYDLVIFDLNLEEGFSNNDDKDHINSIFNSNQIKFDYDNVTKEIAGEYLYLLLLSKGYPKDRMIIYTNNYNKYLDRKDSRLSVLFNFKDTHNLFINKDNSINIGSYFQGNNGDYYRIRRLVYQACEYWKNRLKSDLKEKSSIPFNKIYYDKPNKEYAQIEAASFIDMLEHIELLFPVIKPSVPSKTYYQALQFVSMYHEESADIKAILGSSYYKYHFMIRCFRNCSSHNKFEIKEINAKEFAFLFCIALRTYFDYEKNKELSYKLHNKIYEYEKNYYGAITHEKNIDVSNRWINSVDRLEMFDDRKNSLIDDISISQVIRRLSEQSEKKMQIKDVIFIVFDDFIKAIPQDRKKCNINIPQKNSDKKSDKYSVTFNYTLPVKLNQNVLETLNDTEKMFLDIAATLLDSTA